MYFQMMNYMVCNLNERVHLRNRQSLVVGTEKSDEEQVQKLKSGEGVTARCCNRGHLQQFVTNRLGLCRSRRVLATLSLGVLLTRGLPSATVAPTNHVVAYPAGPVTSSVGSPKVLPTVLRGGHDPWQKCSIATIFPQLWPATGSRGNAHPSKFICFSSFSNFAAALAALRWSSWRTQTHRQRLDLQAAASLFLIS